MRSWISMSRPRTGMNLWGRHRTQPDRNSSSVPARRRSFPFPDKFRPSQSSVGVCWWAGLLLPESTRESVRENEMRLLFSSYPIPTHSKHSLMALLSTEDASPLHMPKQSIAVPATSSAICAAVFCTWLNFITLFVFLYSYHSTREIKFPLRMKN